MTQPPDPDTQPVLPYAAKPRPHPRTGVIPMTVACLAGEFAWIVFSIDENTATLIDSDTLIFLLINTAVLAAGFLAAFFIFRPRVHPALWPPYALATACGAAVMLAWRTIYFYIFIRVFRLSLGVTSAQLLAYFILGMISLGVCLSLLCLYRFTIDRSRQRTL